MSSLSLSTGCGLACFICIVELAISQAPEHNTSLIDLGWSSHFERQLSDSGSECRIARLSCVHRNRVIGFTQSGSLELTVGTGISLRDITVGDWVLYDPESAAIDMCLERFSLLKRGLDTLTQSRQLIAANVDYLFIVTSCNADFNVARLERYLALAYDASVTPVIILTKADQSHEVDRYISEAQALGADLDVCALNAHDPDAWVALQPWCDVGRTIAVTGSSGVGKTTLANMLTGGDERTQGIRENDARGRHTTTRRNLYRLPKGGVFIDTPGVRALSVVQARDGIHEAFSEVHRYADQCKFRNCTHAHEPGCAVQAAVQRGEVSNERVARYLKLLKEDQNAAETIQDARAQKRKTQGRSKRR